MLSTNFAAIFWKQTATVQRQGEGAHIRFINQEGFIQNQVIEDSSNSLQTS